MALPYPIAMRRFSPTIPWRLDPSVTYVNHGSFGARVVPAARRVPSDPPDAIVVRISAQLYNEPADYARLAEVLVRRLRSSA